MEKAERTWSYDLYNGDTEEVEATEQLTAEEVAYRNRVLKTNKEPQRWVPTPWINH